MAYLHETIVCPFCGNGHAHITYEENRVYQLNCPDCHNAIFHQSHSWDSAVSFFKRMGISDDARIRELLAADDEGRLVVLPCKVGDTLFDIYEAKANGEGGVRTLKVTDIHIHLDKRNRAWLIVCGYYLDVSDFGKTIFLTREEAEAALKG